MAHFRFSSCRPRRTVSVQSQGCVTFCGITVCTGELVGAVVSSLVLSSVQRARFRCSRHPSWLTCSSTKSHFWDCGGDDSASEHTNNCTDDDLNDGSNAAHRQRWLVLLLNSSPRHCEEASCSALPLSVVLVLVCSLPKAIPSVRIRQGLRSRFPWFWFSYVICQQ